MAPIPRIRSATPADADSIVQFNAAMAIETESRQLNRDVLRRGVQALLMDPRLGEYLLAEWEGRCVGQLMITYEWSDWRNCLFWWIQSVYVHPDHRSAGVYRALHRHVEQRARSTPGVGGIRLYVEKENSRAQAVYARLGMKETSYRLYETDWSCQA